MQTLERSRALAASVTVALLAGCSSGSTSSPLSSLPAQSAAHKPAQGLSRSELLAETLLVKPGLAALHLGGVGHDVINATACFTGVAIVGDAATDQLYKLTPKGKLTPFGPSNLGLSEPQGLAVDKSGNVYIADTANARIVVLTKKGALLEILNDPGQYPAGVAVAPNGTVGVTNIISQSGGAGSISFYTPGATSPTSSASGVLSEDYFIGADSDDNFYFDGFDASTGAITIATANPNSGTVTNTGIDTSGYSFPGGVQVIQSGRGKKAVQTLNVGDQSGLVVYQYALPGYTPGAKISLGGGSDEVDFALTKNLKYVGSSDAGLGQLETWSWPAGGSSPLCVLGTGGFTEPIGVAFIPTGDE